MDGVIAHLQSNLKTHKPPGQVKPRAIHSATKNPLVPLGKYVAWKLRKVLSRERHILNSVEEFHSRIEELELDQEDRLITADVKDFFVVGDHWYLAKMAASTLEPKDRNLIERVILFLLRNQFVTSTLCESGGIFQVEQGSGIGFVASGEVSDSFFLAVMERQYILKQEVRQKRHIKAYFRYRDDIFLIASGGNGNLGTLAKHWKHVAISYKSPYLIGGWVVSSESVVYLDTEVYQGPRWKTVRKLDSRIHTKLSSLGVPLSPLSSHP